MDIEGNVRRHGQLQLLRQAPLATLFPHLISPTTDCRLYMRPAIRHEQSQTAPESPLLLFLQHLYCPEASIYGYFMLISTRNSAVVCANPLSFRQRLPIRGATARIETRAGQLAVQSWGNKIKLTSPFSTFHTQAHRSCTKDTKYPFQGDYEFWTNTSTAHRIAYTRVPCKSYFEQMPLAPIRKTNSMNGT